MSFRALALTAFALGLAVAGPGSPSCGDRPGDAQAVADARAAAAAECDCATASSHTGYLDCDDGNGCTDDRCIDGKCQHQCLCVAPDGSVSCCPGPAAQCPSPSWFYTCGDPVCGGHRDQGVSPCSGGEAPGAPCSPEGASCDPGDSCARPLLRPPGRP